MARLGDIIEQIRGVSYKPSDLNDNLNDSSVILLRANNIQNGEIVFDDVVYVSKSKVTKSQYLRRGDILVCTSSGSKELVGKAAFVNEDLPMVFGAFCKVVRPKITCCKYIGHFFQSNYYRNYISAASAGANINNLRNEHIADLHITLPTLDEQRRIAAVLDKVSDLIAKRRQQLDKLDLLIKSRFIELFGDPKQNPKGYPVKEFDEISVLITDGEHATPRRTDKGIYLLSARNILNHALQLDDVDYIDEEEYIRIARRVVPQAGDVLISCSGSIGRCCVVPEELRFQMVRSAALIRFDDTIKPIFAEWLISSDELQRQISMSATQSSQANLFQGKIRKLRGYVPPLELQEQFAAFVEQTDKSKFEVQSSLEKLEILKKSLMQRYFG